MSEITTERGRILVAGATGYLGKYVVQAAHAAGYKVVALARDAAKLESLRPCCERIFVGEATDDSTLEGLCDDVDIVFSSLGVRALSGKITYEHVDYGANMNVLRRAEAAGVPRFVFVSVLHGAQSRLSVPQVDARERVVEVLRATEMAWTVLRPTGFFNDMSEFFNMAQKGTVWIVGDGNQRINPIHGADLAAAAIAALDDDATIGAELDLGGPEVLTMRKIAGLAGEVVGKDVTIRSVPAGVLRAIGTLTSPFSANFSNTMKFFGSMADLEGYGEPVGQHYLRDFFIELRDEGMAEDLAVRR